LNDAFLTHRVEEHHEQAAETTQNMRHLNSRESKSIFCILGISDAKKAKIHPFQFAGS